MLSWTKPVLHLPPNGTNPWPKPIFCSPPNGMKPWPKPVLLHHQMAWIHIWSRYFVHHQMERSHVQSRCFFLHQIARNHVQSQCFIYALFYISRAVIPYIYSRQVNNLFLFVIYFLGMINQIIVFIMTYPSCIVNIINELRWGIQLIFGQVVHSQFSIGKVLVI